MLNSGSFDSKRTPQPDDGSYIQRIHFIYLVR